MSTHNPLELFPSELSETAPPTVSPPAMAETKWAEPSDTSGEERAATAEVPREAAPGPDAPPVEDPETTPAADPTTPAEILEPPGRMFSSVPVAVEAERGDPEGALGRLAASVWRSLRRATPERAETPPAPEPSYARQRLHEMLGLEP